MKRIKFLATAIIVHIMFAGSLSSCNSGESDNTTNPQEPEKKEKIEYKEQFPMLGWIGVPPHAEISAHNTMKSAGLTHDLMTFFGNVDQVQEGLDKLQRAGLKGIMNCPELETNTEATIKCFKSHPALAGYTVMDEPRMHNIDEAAQKMKLFQSFDKKGISYLNLLGAGAGDWIGAPFEEYVEAVTTKLPLQMISFSYYPIAIMDGQTERELEPEWYYTLETYSKKSKELNIPLWTLALSARHHHIDRLFPQPTIADLRLQLYSNLAYGSQMMQYYTYWHPRDASVESGYVAPINLDGSKTIGYDRLKAVNEEIIKLSGVFYGAEKIDVWHTGNKLPKGTKALVLPDVFESLETKGDGAVISLLKNGDRHYLMVVNRSFSDKMTLNIKGKSKVQEVDKEAYLNRIDWSNTKQYDIEPGDMRLFSWK